MRHLQAEFAILIFFCYIEKKENNQNAHSKGKGIT